MKSFYILIRPLFRGSGRNMYFLLVLRSILNKIFGDLITFSFNEKAIWIRGNAKKSNFFSDDFLLVKLVLRDMNYTLELENTSSTAHLNMKEIILNQVWTRERGWEVYTLYFIGSEQNRRWKLGQQNAICWNYFGLFRDYGLDHIFFRNNTFLHFKI